jgi:hypothetical protein
VLWYRAPSPPTRHHLRALTIHLVRILLIRAHLHPLSSQDQMSLILLRKTLRLKPSLSRNLLPPCATRRPPRRARSRPKFPAVKAISPQMHPRVSLVKDLSDPVLVHLPGILGRRAQDVRQTQRFRRPQQSSCWLTSSMSMNLVISCVRCDWIILDNVGAHEFECLLVVSTECCVSALSLPRTIIQKSPEQ